MEVTGKPGKTRNRTEELLYLTGVCCILSRKDAEILWEAVILPGNCVAKHVLYQAGFLAICANDDLIYVYSLDEETFVYKFQMKEQCLPLLLLLEDETFSCLVCNNSSAQFEFPNPMPDYEIAFMFSKLFECPKKVDLYQDLISMVDSQQNVTLWPENFQNQVLITKLHHGLSSVDNIKLANKNTLFLFDYKLLRVVKFEIDCKKAAFGRASLKRVFQIAPFVDDPIKLMTVVGEDNSDSLLLLAYADPEEIYALEIDSHSTDPDSTDPDLTDPDTSFYLD